MNDDDDKGNCPAKAGSPNYELRVRVVAFYPLLSVVILSGFL